MTACGTFQPIVACSITAAIGIDPHRKTLWFDAIDLPTAIISKEELSPQSDVCAPALVNQCVALGSRHYEVGSEVRDGL
jgi:hypothetical protein